MHYPKPKEKIERQYTKQPLLSIPPLQTPHQQLPYSAESKHGTPLGLYAPRLWVSSLIPTTTGDSQASQHIPLHDLLGTSPGKQDSGGWTTTRPPEEASSPLSPAVPCQPFPPCMTMASGASPVSGTTVKHSEVTAPLTSQPWRVSLGGHKDWDGEGEVTTTKIYRDALPERHWSLIVYRNGALEVTEVFVPHNRLQKGQPLK